jgi:hypothetical protein
MANPVPIPASDTSPAPVPCDSDRDGRYSMFGPGVSASPSSTSAMPPHQQQ